jgi:hypothetical protein
MTVKEICDLTKKGKSTVYRWIEIASQNGKIESQNGNYLLNETIEIIKAGGNETLANLLKQNADDSQNGKNLPNYGNDRIDRLEIMVDKLISSIPIMINETVKAVINQNKQQEIKALPAGKAQKIEVEITDLPESLARVASAAINNKLKSDEKKRKLAEISPDLFI